MQLRGDFASHVRGGAGARLDFVQFSVSSPPVATRVCTSGREGRAVARKLAVYVRARLKRSRGWSGPDQGLFTHYLTLAPQQLLTALVKATGAWCDFPTASDRELGRDAWRRPTHALLWESR